MAEILTLDKLKTISTILKMDFGKKENSKGIVLKLMCGLGDCRDPNVNILQRFR